MNQVAQSSTVITEDKELVFGKLMITAQEELEHMCKDVRNTPEGLFDAVGAVLVLNRCTCQIYHNIIDRIVVQNPNICLEHKAPDSNCKIRKLPTPIANFSHLLTDEGVGKRIRELQQQILANVLEDNRNLIKNIIANTASRERTSTTLFVPPETTADNNPPKLIKQHTPQTWGRRTEKEGCDVPGVGMHSTLQLEEYIQITLNLDVLWEETVDQRAEESSNSSLVFIIQEHRTRYIKVCFGTDVIKRIEKIQANNHITLSLRCAYTTDHYSRDKQLINQYLYDQGLHVRGDWFSVPEGTSVSEFCTSLLNIIVQIK
jgi:hypothetical protein